MSTGYSTRRVTVSSDGERVVYLHGERLSVFDATTGASRLLAMGVHDYACDPLARVACHVDDGLAYRIDLLSGVVEELPLHGPVAEARPDPTGTLVAYRVGGTLHVYDGEKSTLLAGEEETGIAWAVPEPSAVGFGRERGWWWAPDSSAVVATRVVPADPASGAEATVSLHFLELDGGWVDVHWDRETYPYLVDLRWADGAPLVTVLRRGQNHGLVLAVDPRTGETQVHAELSDPRWVSPIAGTPRHLADGRVLVGGELAHDGYDSRCLFADGTLLTPPGLYVRRVIGRLAPGAIDGELGDLLIAASTDPAEQHIYRVRSAVGRAGVGAQRLTTSPGWHEAHCGGDTVVIGTAALDRDGTQWTVVRRGTAIGELSPIAPIVAGPQPVFDRVVDRRLPTGVLYPTDHLIGRRLPVLVDLATEPSGQGVLATRAAWADRQWWCQAGFIVVAIDPRGTVGVAPSFEKVIHRRLIDLLPTDLADALHALLGKHPDLDLSRVAVRGRGFGGWLAAAAVRDRPETFGSGVVIEPELDWAELPAVIGERYLGDPTDQPEIYDRHRIAVLPPTVVRVPPGAGLDEQLAALRTVLR
ncbi:dipeptidyl-peptidase-4 [Allocatelliglobosispora scoriae]|uniref:Dipeptidyl-peptidase-4 n=1 Tax=Allocatelliglobosispora scoriae TaxID=643052 RepID=A0A841BXL6_9ACTN|nr:prolyl oligopeptidase family serine peptidase [Allocatelliglobosispora scoriae]MBB5871673.1 dipeptidyl-peptidase-4 [Allocatelliglobosispora scoriae]